VDPNLVALLSALLGAIIGAGGAVTVQLMTASRAQREVRRSALHEALLEFVRVAQDAQETVIHARRDKDRKQQVTAAVWVGWRAVLLAAPDSELTAAAYRIADLSSSFLWSERDDDFLPSINPLWREFEIEAVAALEATGAGKKILDRRPG
jgi:hypothetical protein